jgi:hypothetical protein
MAAGSAAPAVAAGSTAIPGDPVADVATFGWRDAILGAARLVRDRPALIGVGLLGFLARGGQVAFLLPIVALPTPIGIANFIGGTALTGAGASEGLVRLIVTGVLLVIVAVVAGISLGAAADVLLGREAIAFALERQAGVVTEADRRAIEREARARLPLDAGLLGRVVLVRAIALLPVAAATAWATARLVAAGYHQLILPDDLRVPLALRILLEAIDGAVVVLIVWLGAEFVGGLAVRHVLVGGRSVPGAFLAALTDLVRRPGTTIATFLLGTAGLLLVAGPTLVLAAALWSRLQSLLADDVLVLLLLPATFLFVLVWAGGLVAIGAVSTWRGLAGGIDVLRGKRLAQRVSVVWRALAPGSESSVVATPSGPVGLEER